MNQKEAQQMLLNEMSKEMDKIFMSWDNDMNEYWYKIAMRALRYTSPVSLGIKQEKFSNLLISEKHGLNLNVVAALCNSIEARSSIDLELNFENYCELLKQNSRIAANWQQKVDPIRERIVKRMQINSARPGIIKPMIN